jgi:hypothetical protein
MNIVTSVYDKLDLFDNSTEVLSMLTSEGVQNAPENIRGDVQLMFSMLGTDPPQEQLNWANDLLQKIAYYEEYPPVFRVNRGEDFSIRIDLEEGRDFTGFNITIRRADDHTLLSPADTEGDSYSNAPAQHAYINDLDLPLGKFFKVHVLLEETDTNNLANGNAITLLTEAWLLVNDSIDASTA